ncbi:hypothetical protein DERP_008352 [Dermatophagoides pteronyssinus]|uniref:Uncharacterized protein n=1 Tax=Dermatophagoides pteronyssinus TaxID=6956 RepID=A0ABQ8J6Q8_DERPT|nr:hypothetical protein DERP_008352 [Dermatophagoides pteronyssinus]
MLFSFNESLWQGSNDQQQQHFASSLAIIIIRYWDNIHFSSGPLVSIFFCQKKMFTRIIISVDWPHIYIRLNARNSDFE